MTTQATDFPQETIKNFLSNLQGLSSDSRQIQARFLFAALPSRLHSGIPAKHGAHYAANAVASGATTILTDDVGAELCKAQNIPSHINLIINDTPQALYGALLKQWYQPQPLSQVAVTGTNGKTSIANFIWQLSELLGKSAATIGTLGVQSAGYTDDVGLTTPSIDYIHQSLQTLGKQGTEVVALEASSHGLDQGRLYGLNLAAAGFTNLTRDHLDYHGDMETYLVAKARLFTDILPEGGVAVLNADIPEFKALNQLCLDNGRKVWSYGENGETLRLVEHTLSATGQTLKVHVFEAGETTDVTISLGLLGAFQAANVLCAVGLTAASIKVSLVDVLKLAEQLKCAHGRMERVGTHANGAAVYVDYAHTPDALERAIEAARAHTENRVITIFGCGGDRDKGKRPMMGAISARLSDVNIVADDNPRSEQPEAIRTDIMVAFADYPNAVVHNIGDRAKAIQMGVAMLEAGDCLLITGKGHEQGQKFITPKGAVILPFDDSEVAKAALKGDGQLSGQPHGNAA